MKYSERLPNIFVQCVVIRSDFRKLSLNHRRLLRKGSWWVPPVPCVVFQLARIVNYVKVTCLGSDKLRSLTILQVSVFAEQWSSSEFIFHTSSKARTPLPDKSREVSQLTDLHFYWWRIRRNRSQISEGWPETASTNNSCQTSLCRHHAAADGHFFTFKTSLQHTSWSPSFQLKALTI